jgi:putative endonuclease
MAPPRAPSGRRTEQQRRGQQGEDRALDYLTRQGLVLVERNFRCQAGEIDLIMRHQAYLVFVEVRRRASASFGGAAASVTSAKQRRLILAAQYYLLRHRAPPPCRFDLVALDGEKLTWLQNMLEM